MLLLNCIGGVASANEGNVADLYVRPAFEGLLCPGA